MPLNDDRVPPVHLYYRPPAEERERPKHSRKTPGLIAGGNLPRIGCGVSVSRPSQYTDDPLKVSCRKCAKKAPGLTEAQREEAWGNANERLNVDTLSPWMRAAERERKKREREEKKKAKAAAAAEKAKKRAARAAATPF